ncbi:hypothetical protein BC628DRAFT_1367214 [Trametes gibbosa]|nr:hypothetical protein BC628DRAFT_1367214 [Trametes gibbosa]
MSEPFPECDYFCEHVGRLSLFPSTCSTAEDFITRDCTCAESPVKQNIGCLQSLCSPEDFDSIVAAEVTRCGPGVVQTTTTTQVPVITGETLLRRGVVPSFEGVTSASPGRLHVSPSFLFHVLFATLVVGFIVYLHHRRRTQRAIQIEGATPASFVGY